MLCLGWEMVCQSGFLNVCFTLRFRSFLYACTSERSFPILLKTAVACFLSFPGCCWGLEWKCFLLLYITPSLRSVLHLWALEAGPSLWSFHLPSRRVSLMVWVLDVFLPFPRVFCYSFPLLQDISAVPWGWEGLVPFAQWNKAFILWRYGERNGKMFMPSPQWLLFPSPDLHHKQHFSRLILSIVFFIDTQWGHFNIIAQERGVENAISGG